MDYPLREGMMKEALSPPVLWFIVSYFLKKARKISRFMGFRALETVARKKVSPKLV